MVVLEGDFFSPASRDSDATTPPESGNADVDVPFKSNPFNMLPKCKGWRTHKHRLRLKGYTDASVFRSQKDMTKWPIGHSLVNGFFSLNLSWIWWYLVVSDHIWSLQTVLRPLGLMHRICQGIQDIVGVTPWCHGVKTQGEQNLSRLEVAL